MYNIITLFVMFSLLLGTSLNACTSLLVSKGASRDGSVMITYTCDGRFHPRLRYTPAANHEPGDSLKISHYSGKVRGKIPQVAQTYAVIGLMNEVQLAIGETTFGGREELRDPNGLLHYWNLMQLALQRAKTARQAIEVMTDLVRDYGYGSTGESFSIADTEEAWILEMIGKGENNTGAVWVARRVPDGMISCHANQSRIGEFPLDDPQNCLYSKDVISFAIEKGYYDPDAGVPFRFCDAYSPSTAETRRFSDTRVWSLFRRAAPSKEFDDKIHRGLLEESYPLFIQADTKLGLRDVFDLMRDHYEGTPYDMRRGIPSGPFGTPNRCRPLVWHVDSVKYAWERPVSTFHTGFSFVSQSRAWLPNAIGGVYWYGVDDTYSTCYVPLYCGIDKLPPSYTTGTMKRFSWKSAWWIFNFVANFANIRYNDMIKDIKAVQEDIESHLIGLQPAVEKTAAYLAKENPDLLKRYLTDFSVSHAEQVVSRWRELAEFLITKYNDGYVDDESGEVQKSYPQEWLQDLVRQQPDRYRLHQSD
jgi:dipeptidase